MAGREREDAERTGGGNNFRITSSPTPDISPGRWDWENSSLPFISERRLRRWDHSALFGGISMCMGEQEKGF